MCEVSDQEPVEELIMTLEPDALPANTVSRDDRGVVNTHVDLVADNLCQTERQGDVKGYVFDESVSRVW